MGLASVLHLIGIYGAYERYLKNQISKEMVPSHLAIILDGNRRWAHSKLYSSRVGHNTGAKTARNLLEWCLDLKIRTLTVYALSTENLQRSYGEVTDLMDLIEEELQAILVDNRIHRYHIRVEVLGRKEMLTEKIRRTINDIEKSTSKYNEYFLNLALAYGGRHEIVDVVKKIAGMCKSGKLDPNGVNQKTIEDHLYTSNLPNPEPELIIRTSGEERLSGFLLWQGAYSELVFLDVYWPDFRKIDLMRAIRTYQRRLRRFGK